MMRFQAAAGHPAVDFGGALALFLGRGVEHGETVQRAVFYIERADWQRRARIAAGHDDYPPAHGHVFDGQVEILFAQRFPPHVDGAEFFQRGFEIVGLVVDGHVCADLAAELHFLIAAGGGEDSCADGPGHLHHGRTDAARAAVYE